MRLRLEHGRRDDLKTLHPAYFALVMATGIVAIAAHLHGIPVLPKVLFWLNALFLAGLTAATVVRVLRYPRALTLIFFRYTFVHIAPEDLAPPYWINMGAVAISALVGATLIEHTAPSRDVKEIVSFVMASPCSTGLSPRGGSPCCWCSEFGAI